jgi:hypothetical protein
MATTRTKDKQTKPKHTSLSRNGSTSDALYHRPDWTMFRSVANIAMAAGVSVERLTMLAAKELTDNALDAGASRPDVGLLPGGGFFVQDDGPGIQTSPEKIAYIFSFNRPLASSKVKRLPTRGALGNGTRVIAGLVYATKGRLRVASGGWVLDLEPEASGHTRIRSKKRRQTTGTRVEVWLGKVLAVDDGDLFWARQAIDAAGDGPIYCGKTSAWYYDSDAFHELLQAAGSRPVRDVLGQDFDCPAAFARRAAEQFGSRSAESLTFGEAEKLLKAARTASPLIGPDQLSLVGKHLPGTYAKKLRMLDLPPSRGSVGARLPVTIEAWCHPADGGDALQVFVNRTPVTGEISIHRNQKSKADVAIFGSNLSHRFTVGRREVDLTINVQTPSMPITSTGKEPDLKPLARDIIEVVESAAAKCQRANRPAQPEMPLSILPAPRRRGRQTAEDDANHTAEMERFADELKQIAKSGFKALRTGVVLHSRRTRPRKR